ncbi:MAG: GGDEF domain-containing protein [Pseudomonadota bacterium]
MTPTAFNYLGITMTLACLMYSVISFFAWRVLLRKPYTFFWHLAFVASTARWGASLISGTLLSAPIKALLIELSALGVIVFASMGHCIRVESSRVLRYILACAFASFLVLIWATFVSPHDGLREAAVPAASFATASFLAFAVYRYRSQGWSADHAFIAGLVLFGISQLGASIRAYNLGPIADQAALAAQQHIELLTLPIAYIAISTLVLSVFVSDMSDRLKGMAVVDQLTGLLNRHGFEGLGQRAFENARSEQRPLSVVLADLDHFKAVNDRFGHAVGDKALIHFAHRLQIGRRQDDIVARIGGEEFLIVLPDTDIVAAERVAQLVRVSTSKTPVVDGERPLMVSASFGVAEISDEDANIADMVARADRAMYRAKRLGRNRVERASQHALTLSETTLQRL